MTYGNIICDGEHKGRIWTLTPPRRGERILSKYEVVDVYLNSEYELVVEVKDGSGR